MKERPWEDVFDEDSESSITIAVLGVIALVAIAVVLTVCLSSPRRRAANKNTGEKGKTASGGAPGTLSATVRNARSRASRRGARVPREGLGGRARRRRLHLLYHCAAHGHAELARAALAHGGDVNAVDASLRTGLHLAARGGHGALVKLLLDAGADAAMVDGQGESAQALAEGAKNQGCALLIKRRLKVAAAGSASSASSPGLSLRHERTADGVPPV